MNDLDAHLLRRTLPHWVPEFRFLPETDSTNRQASVWARAGAAHGCLVVADHQTAGRGRLDRRWIAPAGSSLLFSAVLRPWWEPELWGLLSLAAGVAVCECLQDFGVTAAVKWPNDVLLGDGKVAGILAEVAGDAVILGVGVNVSQVAFPLEISPAATSLRHHTGRSFGRGELLGRLIGHLAALVDGPADAILHGYRPWCRTLGRRVKVDLGSELLEDRAVDIDGTGGLVLAGGLTVRAADILQVR